MEDKNPIEPPARRARVARLTLAAGVAVLLGVAASDGWGDWWRGPSGSGRLGTGPWSVPKLRGDEATAADVRAAFEPAPAGFEWVYRLDWDDAVIAKCLVIAPRPGGPIDAQTHDALRANSPLPGYTWQWRPAPGAPNTPVEVCLSRTGCPYGKEKYSQECVVPR